MSVPAPGRVRAVPTSLALLVPVLAALAPPAAARQVHKAPIGGGGAGPVVPALCPCPQPWRLAGNVGTNPVIHFLGTIDAAPLHLRVDNTRCMRYEHASNGTYHGINVLGGASINAIQPGVIGATIAGGGEDHLFGTDYPNDVTADLGTIGGGAGNLVTSPYATVGGGSSNTAGGLVAVVAGGAGNTASAANPNV